MIACLGMLASSMACAMPCGGDCHQPASAETCCPHAQRAQSSEDTASGDRVTDTTSTCCGGEFRQCGAWPLPEDGDGVLERHVVMVSAASSHGVVVAPPMAAERERPPPDLRVSYSPTKTIRLLL